MSGLLEDEQLQRSERLLFPISVGNPSFSSARVREALRPLLAEEFDEYVFLIADQLQLYNSCRRVENAAELGATFARFRLRNRELEGKKHWLEHLERTFRAEGFTRPWRIIGFEDVTDTDFTRVYRSLLIAFSKIAEFQSAVKTTASHFLAARFGDSIDESWRRLSEFYILEEIALNLRVRVWDRITVECYLGNYPEPLLGIYRGDYGISIADLTGRDVPGSTFRFVRASDLQSVVAQ